MQIIQVLAKVAALALGQGEQPWDQPLQSVAPWLMMAQPCI